MTQCGNANGGVGGNDGTGQAGETNMTTTAKKTKKKDAEAPRLTRDDWLEAAFDAVAEGGFDKVRVLALAEKLGVTRGSFYWHFTDHADLIQAILTRWRDREAAIHDSVPDDAARDPRIELEQLLEAALALANDDVKSTRFELALRGLARRDPTVEKLLVEVDQMRMQLFENKFRRLIDDPAQAADLASLFYLAIVGSLQALSRPTRSPRLKDYLKRIITEYLIERQ